MKCRVSFLVDGFNLYYSIRESENARQSVKWLNLARLCRSYLHLFGNNASLESIFYFSALPEHIEPKKPGTIRRHKNYIKCLESTGVLVELGRFKYRGDFKCDGCGYSKPRYEEKETDVSIAVKLMELLFTNKADAVVIVSGDTDLAPVARVVADRFKNKTVRFAFPYKRFNLELKNLAPKSFKIKKKSYFANQFPDTVQFGTSAISKPESW